MTDEEIQEAIDDAIDQLKSEMQDETNTLAQDLDSLKIDVDDLRQEIEI